MVQPLALTCGNGAIAMIILNNPSEPRRAGLASCLEPHRALEVAHVALDAVQCGSVALTFRSLGGVRGDGVALASTVTLFTDEPEAGLLFRPVDDERHPRRLGKS